MASTASILGNIGGVSTPISIGTPGLPGTGGVVPSSSGSILSSVGNAALAPLAFGAGLLGFSDPSSALSSLTGTNTATASNGTSSNTGSGGSDYKALISDFFLRGTIIILGFIFVAVGLSMFKSGGATVLEHIKKQVGK